MCILSEGIENIEKSILILINILLFFNQYYAMQGSNASKSAWVTVCRRIRNRSINHERED